MRTRARKKGRKRGGKQAREHVRTTFDKTLRDAQARERERKVPPSRQVGEQMGRIDGNERVGKNERSLMALKFSFFFFFKKIQYLVLLYVS